MKKLLTDAKSTARKAIAECRAFANKMGEQLSKVMTAKDLEQCIWAQHLAGFFSLSSVVPKCSRDKDKLTGRGYPTEVGVFLQGHIDTQMKAKDDLQNFYVSAEDRSFLDSAPK